MPDKDYFRDEVRCGFYIPTAVKQAWAAEIAVLAEIDRICVKYDIQYYAEWGTLLGAVRHGGFVPWDDDLDIGMKREDYRRFLAVAEKELPEGYAIYDYQRKEDHWLFLSRVVNRNRMCFEEEHLKCFHNFPYIAAVDIFIQDRLYREPEKEKERCEEVLYLISLADGIRERSIKDGARETELHRIADRYGVALQGLEEKQIAVELYRLAEIQMGRVADEDADELGQIFPWIIKGYKGLNKRLYERTVRLPFEQGTIPVPAGYGEILKARYGDYLLPVKGKGAHDYPYFEAQRKELAKVADFELPEFRFSAGLLKRHACERQFSCKSLCREGLQGLEVLTEEIRKCCSIQDAETIFSHTEEAQQLAVDMGTIIEKTRGEEEPLAAATVGALSAYCESLFLIYQQAEEGRVSSEAQAQLADAIEKVRAAVEKNVLNRREVLFLASGSCEAFRKVAEEESGEDTDLTWICLPLMEKDPFGRLMEDGKGTEDVGDNEDDKNHIRIKKQTGDKEGTEDFDSVNVHDWRSYELSLHAPEMIFCQDPYDGENPVLSVPPAYYTTELQKYSEKLIYIPAMYSADFRAEDTNDIKNMKYYVTAPALFSADEVWLSSEVLRERYIEALCAFAGEDTKKLWEEKLRVRRTEKAEEKKENDGAKRILYCIGINEFYEIGDALPDKIRDRQRIFSEHEGRITVLPMLYPPDPEEWENAGAESVVKLLEENALEGTDLSFLWEGRKGKEAAAYCDAYYGSPTPLISMFTECKKPVMVCNYQI